MNKNNLTDFISIKTNASNTNLIFLIDTEATISLIKIGCISNKIIYNKSDIVKLIGITKQPIFSLGSFNLKIVEQNIEYDHKVHLVPDDFLIPSNGILGKDFLKRFKCSIDFGDMTLTLRKHNEKSIVLPIKSELIDGLSAIPPRSESFKIFHIKSEHFPCIIETQEIEENVIIPTTIAHEKSVWIRVLNVSNDTKIINTENVKTNTLQDFHIFSQFNENEHTVDRLNKLNRILKRKVPEFVRNKLLSLCMKFSDIFHIEGDKCTVNNFYEQQIRLSDNTPVFTKNYRLPYTQKAEVDRQVRELLENDLIELSTSPYNSPLIIVPKKTIDGKPKYRMCIDYRKLNRKIIPDKFPLPRIEEILESLGKAKFFTVMDLYSGFHQIPLAEKSRNVTAFSTDIGFFQWKVLPFGLNIAPSSFSRMMTIAFSGLSPQQSFIYMDDLIVIGSTENQHLHNLENVFEMCRQHNLKLNPEKCDFFKNEVTFLGHNCTSDGLKPDSKKLDTIHAYPRPENKDDVRRFVAFANYYRRFIKNFSIITYPLTSLLKKRVDFVWSENCEKSFQEIKTKLISTPILSYPDFTKQFKVTVDASHLGCGAVISQDQDGSDKPISFISRTFKNGEKNKAIIEKELIAIHFALQTFRPYLYGQKFIVYSDHKPLVYLFKLKNPSSKLMRIKMDLEEFDFEIEHIKGKENVVADALSRISIKDLFELYEENHIFKLETIPLHRQKQENKSKTEIRNTNPILAFTRSMKRQQNSKNTENVASIIDDINTNISQQVHDNCIQIRKNPRVRITNCKINKNGIPTQINLSAYKHHKKIFEIILGLDNEKVTLLALLSKLQDKAKIFNIKLIEWPLHDYIFEMCTVNEFKKLANTILTDLQINLVKTPKEIKNDEEKINILEKFHKDELFGGHCGHKKLYAKIKDHFYWRKMTRDIAKYIKNCKVCKLSTPNKKTREELELTPTPCKPFETVQIDTIGPLTKSNSGNQYAVTIIDEMSKWLTIIPIANKSAKDISKAIFENFILIFGPMKEIKTDLGTEYRNKIIHELSQLLKIKHSFSTAYHHETVGAIERSHRVLNEYLRKFLNGQLNEWDTFANYFQFLYNTTKHDGLLNKYSPFEIVFLRKNTMPHEIFNGKIEKLYNIDDYVKECKIKLQLVYSETQKLIEKSKQTNKKSYDKNINPINLKIGDLVKIIKQPYDKFKYIYDGPYEVKNIYGKNVEIELENGNLYEIHKNRVLKY